MTLAGVELVTDPSDKRWLAFVDSIPSANIFHHPAWVNLIADCYGYRPFVIAVYDGNDKIQAGLPMVEVKRLLTGHRWISLPFSDHVSLLSHEGGYQDAIYNYLQRMRIEFNLRSVEVRSDLPIVNGVIKDDREVIHLLKLSPNPKNVFDNFHPGQVKRNITKAERNGLTIRRAEFKQDLDSYYKLQVKTRQRLGLPVQPKRYFELLWQRVISAGLGFLLLVYKDDIPVAGGVFLTYKNTLTYKYGASDLNNWRYRPNHLLFWTAIRWGCEHGYTIMDWGKTRRDLIGLRSFKDGWGTEESTLVYSFITSHPPYQLEDRLSGVTRKFIQNAPLWMCQMIGDLYYRLIA